MAESDKGSGNWMMTYADFITLMMIFFIVLYTFTPGVEKEKFEAIIGAFKGSRGVLQHQSVFSDEMLKVKIQRSKNWDELKKTIIKNNLQKQVKLKMVPDGVRITLSEPVTFNTYSATLLPSAYKVLKVIAHSIEKYKNEPLKRVEVLGYTDNRPVVKNARRYPTNWALGAARAISVVKFFMKYGTVENKKFEVSTFGKYHPKYSNTTKEGRRRNRRVQIYIRYNQKIEPDS